MFKTAVLIPCFNEEQTIAKVIQDFRSAVPEAKIYVYNNNSTDRTVEIVKQLSLEDSKVILRHEFRQGKGNVIRSMFRDIDADCYLITDGDDTYPASIAPEMIRLVNEGQADMVIGDRLSSTYFTQNKRRFHNNGNLLVKQLINWLFRTHLNDIMTGYRAFSREFVKGFPVLSTGFEIETEMTVHAVDKNFLIRNIPVDYRDRPTGSVSKLNTISDGFRVLKTIFILFKDYKPLAFFCGISTITILTTLGLFVPILMSYFKTGLVAKFPSLIVAGAFGVSSLLLLSVGIILDAQVQRHRQLYEIMINMMKMQMNKNEQ